MKNLLLIVLSLFLATACGNSGEKKTNEKAAVTENGTSQDASTVYVYYFHGKQRCKTCNAVEKVAKQTIEANYGDNKNVKFMVLPTDDKAYEALLEKYEISWNGLIIDKGDNSINITEQAFANAVNSPEVLVELIKSEVNNRLN